MRLGVSAALLVVVGLPLATIESGASATPARPAVAVPKVVLPATIANPPAAACPASYDLYAERGTMTLPGATAPVNVFGYSSTATAVTAPGGPTLVACAGTPVTINLYNGLTASGAAPAETTSLLFQGQPMAPDRTGIAAGPTPKSYTLSVAQPGTYLYEAGLTGNAQHQVAMGLYGVLVVRPATNGVPTAGQAYGPTTAFDEEAIVLTSEIDPKLNNAADPTKFDLRTYKPTYGLVNGDAYPNGSSVSTAPGHKVLLRYVNAGILSHSMGVLGLNQTLIANDGSPYRDARHVVAETFGPGQTADVLTTIPTAAPTGSKFAVYDASLSLNNGATTSLGGMLTFLQVGASTASGPAAAINSIATVGSPVTSIAGFNGTVTASLTGGAITEAHYYLDSLSSPAVAIATVPTSGAAFDVLLAAPIPTAGVHTIYLQASDANGLGPVAQLAATIPTTVPVDALAPTTTNSAVNPTATVGSSSSAVTVTAQASDVGTGGSDIASATFAIQGGAGSTAMTVTKSGVATANLSATIPGSVLLGLTEGAHTVSVLSTDAAGNTGVAASTILTVDRTAPTTAGVAASKNPTNGAIGYDANTPAVRVTATATDTLSNVGGAEGFLDTVGGVGTGFLFSAADGFFDSKNEGLRADIPLTTIAQLTNGNHTVYVRSKDALGNWDLQPAASLAKVVFTVDKVAPVLTTVTPASATVVFGAAGSTTFALSATDTGGTGVSGGQYWIDGSATPTAFGGATFSVTTSALSGGAHTVYARAADSAGNFSGVKSATVYVVLAVADTQSVTASTAIGTQQVNATGSAGVLTNDQPTGIAGRTVKLITAVSKAGGNNVGTFSLTCSGGTPTTVGASSICTSGSYRLDLTVPSLANNTLRQAARRGTYTFSYAEVLNGVTSNTVTVTITVN